MTTKYEALKYDIKTWLAADKRLIVEVASGYLLDTVTGREMTFDFAEAYAKQILEKIGKAALAGQQNPLSDDAVHNLAQGNYHPLLGINPIRFARAIERAHGIGE